MAMINLKFLRLLATLLLAISATSLALPQSGRGTGAGVPGVASGRPEAQVAAKPAGHSVSVQNKRADIHYDGAPKANANVPGTDDIHKHGARLNSRAELQDLVFENRDIHGAQEADTGSGSPVPDPAKVQQDPSLVSAKTPKRVVRDIEEGQEHTDESTESPANVKVDNEDAKNKVPSSTPQAPTPPSAPPAPKKDVNVETRQMRNADYGSGAGPSGPPSAAGGAGPAPAGEGTQTQDATPPPAHTQADKEAAAPPAAGAADSDKSKRKLEGEPERRDITIPGPGPDPDVDYTRAGHQ